MNRATVISTTAPIMLKLAQLALFAEIQTNFNLHPGQIAKDLKKVLSPGESLAKKAADLLQEAKFVFETRLSETQALLAKGGGRIVGGLSGEKVLTEYFNLDPRKMAEGIRCRIKKTGEDPDALMDERWTQGQIVAICLKDATGEMLTWAFQEAVRIAEQQKSK